MLQRDWLPFGTKSREKLAGYKTAMEEGVEPFAFSELSSELGAHVLRYGHPYPFMLTGRANRKLVASTMHPERASPMRATYYIHIEPTEKAPTTVNAMYYQALNLVYPQPQWKTQPSVHPWNAREMAIKLIALFLYLCYADPGESLTATWTSTMAPNGDQVIITVRSFFGDRKSKDQTVVIQNTKNGKMLKGGFDRENGEQSENLDEVLLSLFSRSHFDGSMATDQSRPFKEGSFVQVRPRHKETGFTMEEHGSSVPLSVAFFYTFPPP